MCFQLTWGAVVIAIFAVILLHLKLAKTQLWRGTPVRNFCLIWSEDPHAIQIFDVGRYNFNLDLYGERHNFNLDVWSWKTLPLISIMPCAGSMYKEMEEGRFSSWADCSHLARKSIPSQVLELTMLRFQIILKMGWDIQVHGLSNS